MKRIVLLCYVCALSMSCSTQSSSDDQASIEENFYALRVGNSWVYKNYKYNPATQFYDDIGVIDSISIIGTEELKGQTFYKFRRYTTGNEEGIAFCNPNGEHFELLRDSIGFLIRNDGSIKYVSNNYDEHLIETQSWGDQYFQLQDNDVQIGLPSGTFTSLNLLHFVRLSNNQVAPGMNNYYYSKGVGRVFETNSFVSDDTHQIEKRLHSYTIH